MKVLIVASSKLPVPAVKGGAVPNLIETLLRENEKDPKVQLDCISLYDKEAEIQSKALEKTNFIWAKVPKFVRAMDKVLYFVMKKIFRMKRLHSISFLFQIAWYGFFIGKVLKKGKYERVVFENSIPVLFSLKLYKNAKRYKDKYFLHMHSVPRKYYGNKKQVRACRKLICVSEYVARSILSDKRLGLDPDKIEVMYNCINLDLFQPIAQTEIEKTKEKYAIAPDKKVLLFVGRLCKEKGIEEVLKAMKALSREDCVLLVVGSNFYKAEIVGPYEKRLQEECEEIKDRVVFTGYVDYPSISSVYAIADVVALPSIWEEPAGMTMIEAMACKKPVITTRSGGIPEYVGEGNCILLERDEKLAENMARKIEWLLENAQEAEEISEKGAKRVSSFHGRFYYEQFLSIVNK